MRCKRGPRTGAPGLHFAAPPVQKRHLEPRDMKSGVAYPTSVGVRVRSLHHTRLENIQRLDLVRINSFTIGRNPRKCTLDWLLDRVEVCSPCECQRPAEDEPCNKRLRSCQLRGMASWKYDAGCDSRCNRESMMATPPPRMLVERRKSLVSLEDSCLERARMRVNELCFDPGRSLHA